MAERCPALIRRIVAAGHEVASHGWDHQRVFTMDAATFCADLARARATIEDAGGVAVTGYRAPSFSIDTRTPWAHSVLAEAGYTYSSSVAPSLMIIMAGAKRRAMRLARSPMPALIELPVTVAEWAGRRMATGGGFFRLFPGGADPFRGAPGQ